MAALFFPYYCVHTRIFKARYARPMFIHLLLIFLYLISTITMQKIAMLFFFEIFETCDVFEKISRKILGKTEKGSAWLSISVSRSSLPLLHCLQINILVIFPSEGVKRTPFQVSAQNMDLS